MESKKDKFEFLEHTADVKFRAYGKTIDEAFQNSALAMFNVMYTGKVKEKIKEEVKVEGTDNESLLYNFLEELLFLLDTKDFFLSSCKVKIKDKKDGKREGKKLEAEVKGDNAKNYETKIDVKAVTYNEMFVKKEKGKWMTQVVVDV